MPPPFSASKEQFFSAQCAIPGCERSRHVFRGIDIVFEETATSITYLWFCLRCSMAARYGTL